MLCLYIIFAVSRTRFVEFIQRRVPSHVGELHNTEMIAVVIITVTVFLHRQSGFRTGVTVARGAGLLDTTPPRSWF